MEQFRSKCEKICYATRKEAKKSLRRHVGNGQLKGKLAVYPCRQCSEILGDSVFHIGHTGAVHLHGRVFKEQQVQQVRNANVER